MGQGADGNVIDTSGGYAPDRAYIDPALASNFTPCLQPSAIASRISVVSMLSSRMASTPSICTSARTCSRLSASQLDLHFGVLSPRLPIAAASFSRSCSATR